MSQKLADLYLDLLDTVPDNVRMRQALEQELAQAMTHGHHACIRGFPRIGKTTLLGGTLRAACRRTEGAAIVTPLHAEEKMTLSTALGQVATQVSQFLQRVGASELKVDAQNPLAVLSDLAAPLFVGIDNLVALSSLSAADAQTFLSRLLTTPKNVKVCLVAQRHPACDDWTEAALREHANVVSVFVPALSDEELVQLIQPSAESCKTPFSDEALGALALASGNRPSELLAMAALVAGTVDEEFQGAILVEQVEALLSIEKLSESEIGQALVRELLATLVGAMNADERKLIEVVAAGGEAEIAESAMISLQQGTFLLEGDQPQLNGVLLEVVARAVADGEIKVSVE
jgi:hypothetical protein